MDINATTHFDIPLRASQALLMFLRTASAHNYQFGRGFRSEPPGVKQDLEEIRMKLEHLLLMEVKT